MHIIYFSTITCSLDMKKKTSCLDALQSQAMMDVSSRSHFCMRNSQLSDFTIRLMAEILHQLIGSLSHDFTGFHTSRVVGNGISAINSRICF